MENNWSTAVVELNKVKIEEAQLANGSSAQPSSRVIVAAERGGPNASVLSRREIHVLEEIREGMKNPEIAAKLELSTKTVENHVRNILLKLAVKNRTQAVVEALRRSIITF